MKLTDDFLKAFLEEVCNNRRDAELWNQTLEDTTPNEVYERLKKRIEELENHKKRPYSEKLEVIIDELQKILGGEDESNS